MPPDRLTLGFDTSAAHCAAALLWPDGKALARAEAMERGQAERLVPLLEELLADAGAGWGDVGRIGVGTGPGNFTGVRIAVAAGRGLALASGVPAVGVTRFEALALGQARPCLVALDARRGESWVQAFGNGDFPGGKSSGGRFPEGNLLGGKSPGGDFRGPRLLAAGESVPVDGFASVVGDAAWLEGAVMPGAEVLAANVARIAAGAERLEAPSPAYLRGPDAAPPRDPPPVILP